MPELLQNHPVTSARIAESTVRSYDISTPAESVSYALSRERLRLLSLSGDPMRAPIQPELRRKRATPTRRSTGARRA